MDDQEWQKEQKRVDHVMDVINNRMQMLEQQISKYKSDVVAIRKNFWDDVTVNFEDASEAGETYSSIKQQAEVLSERERTFRHIEKQLNALYKQKHSPYFGRVDFIEKDPANEEIIYIGIASLLDHNESDFLVYDWRAPVSSLYYDHSPGPAQYDTPGGEISGELLLKRQYIIRDGRIESLFDTGVTIGDELLQQVLGKQADTQMRSIVATIQQEQNRIIRNVHSRVLVVQGAAGSGKTSAVLQRAAYLLYRFRDVLRADQMVFFSPNPMFNSYISTVLPELGEENMQQTTFLRYLAARLGKQFDIEDAFSQMEYTLTEMDHPDYDARLEGIRYKASADFIKVSEAYLGSLKTKGLQFKNIKFKDQVLIPAKQIKNYFYTLKDSISIPNRLQMTAEWLLKEMKRLAQLEVKKAWVQDEIMLLSADVYQKAHNELKRKSKFTEASFDDAAREEELLAKWVIQKRFKRLRAAVKQLKFVNIKAIYRQLFSQPDFIKKIVPDAQIPKFWREICLDTIDMISRSKLNYEDTTPYLYIKDRIEGFQTHNEIRHVFIDEGQDYSPFQYAFLKRLFPRSKMTVLGDLNQTIFNQAAVSHGFQPLIDMYEEEQTEWIELTRSYRSTQQIVEFTREMIPRGERVEPFNRPGSQPKVVKADHMDGLIHMIKEQINTLQNMGYESIAVICKTAKESEQAYQLLKPLLSIQIINKETSSFDGGIVAVPSYLAKGVEFDAVIIFNGSQEQYGREEERRLFYTACTRAMHELHIFYIGEMSTFISDIPQEYYLRM